MLRYFVIDVEGSYSDSVPPLPWLTDWLCFLNSWFSPAR